MRVLSIGTDRNLFEPDSEVRTRQITSAQKLDQLQIIVFAKKTLGLLPQKISPNVFIYPTNSQSRFFYLRDAIKLGKKLSGFDLITTQDPFECGWVGWRLARYFRTKLELQIHTDFLNPHFARESWSNKLRLRLARFLLPRANQVRVVSQRIADSIARAGIKLKQAPVVLPVYIDLEKIKQAPIKTDLHQKYPQFKKIILMASRLTREKNIELAINSLPAILRNVPGVGLIIVGIGPEEKKLKNLVTKLRLKKNTIFEPWTADLASYYKTADLFLLTSDYEGYGRTIVEALACGCPVVSTDVGVASEAGAVVVGQPRDLTSTLLNFLAP